jgi:hypothetical protein
MLAAHLKPTKSQLYADQALLQAVLRAALSETSDEAQEAHIMIIAGA